MQRFPSENTLFTKDVGTQDQVLWLKLMMLGIKVTDANWVQILPIGAFYNFYTSVFSRVYFGNFDYYRLKDKQHLYRRSNWQVLQYLPRLERNLTELKRTSQISFEGNLTDMLIVIGGTQRDMT